jgi:hypothetical protein
VFGAADFQHSAVVWVDLSMECLDSCQYLLASTFLTQAIARAPHPELLLLLAEVSAFFTHPCMGCGWGGECPLFVDSQA